MFGSGSSGLVCFVTYRQGSDRQSGLVGDRCVPVRSGSEGQSGIVGLWIVKQRLGTAVSECMGWSRKRSTGSVQVGYGKSMNGGD